MAITEVTNISKYFVVFKSTVVTYQLNIGNPGIKSESLSNVFSRLYFEAFSSRKLRGSNEWAKLLLFKNTYSCKLKEFLKRIK